MSATTSSAMDGRDSLPGATNDVAAKPHANGSLPVLPIQSSFSVVLPSHAVYEFPGVVPTLPPAVSSPISAPGSMLRSGDQGDMRWMDHQPGTCRYTQLIIELPGVGGHLEHPIILARQGLLHP